MIGSVEEAIDRLKRHLGAKTEAELARQLRTSQSTISSWKTRGRVPQRFLNILKGESSLAVAAPPVHWAAHENAAMSVALFRYTRIYADVSRSSDFPALMSMLGRTNEIWDLFRQAQWDLLKCMEEGGHSLSSAVAIVLHSDVEDGDTAIERDRRLLEQKRPSIEWSDGTVTSPSGKSTKPVF